MRKLVALLLGLALAVIACGGVDDQARREDERIAGEQLRIYQQAQPVPLYDFSQVRETLIRINALLIEGRQGYATIVNPLTGEPLFSCPSIGFPIPADTQVTNPQNVSRENAVIEQVEPNGTFTSKNTQGTYILCVASGGRAIPVYSEPPVIASGAPLVWDPTTGQYQFEGEPSMVIEVGK